jgi:branched-chain amino acid transport system permease protein
MVRGRYVPVLALIVVVIAVQSLTSVFRVNFYLTQLTMSAYYGLVVLGLCLLMGYAGQISIGQAGFFAIGGYSTATLTTLNLMDFAENPPVRILGTLGILTRDVDAYGNEILHIAPWVSCLAALLITVLIALLIGLPVLKLKGHYLAMATLGFGTIVYRVVIGTRVFGEADGITRVPPFRLFPGVAVSGSFANRVVNYYIAWFLVVAGIVIAINLINSRIGRALRSLHGGEDAAEAMGVDTSRYKLNVFVLSALYAAVGGIFLTHFNGGIGPSEASIIKSVRYVAIVAVGGMANIWGALLMGVLLNFLSLRGVFGSYDDAVFGAILIFIMIAAPSGLLKAPFARRFLELSPLRFISSRISAKKEEKSGGPS